MTFVGPWGVTGVIQMIFSKHALLEGFRPQIPTSVVWIEQVK